MLPADAVPPVDGGETLHRFVLTRRHVRRADGTVKADAFVPHPHTAMSVNRDRDAADAETWKIGHEISRSRGKTLHGRGDAVAASYQGQGLHTVADRIAPNEVHPDGNPNHVDVTGWPADDKARQKLIAQEIATVAKFVEPPGAVPEP